MFSLVKSTLVVVQSFWHMLACTKDDYSLCTSQNFFTGRYFLSGKMVFERTGSKGTVTIMRAKRSSIKHRVHTGTLALHIIDQYK